MLQNLHFPPNCLLHAPVLSLSACSFALKISFAQSKQTRREKTAARVNQIWEGNLTQIHPRGNERERNRIDLCASCLSVIYRGLIFAARQWRVVF